MTEDHRPGADRGADDGAADHSAEPPFPPMSTENTGSIPPVQATGPVGVAAEDVNAPADEESMMKSSAVMAVGTIISRLTGVLRDTALTAALGLTIVRDAFALGNSLPNIVYVLIVGGALNAVFVPQLVRRMKDDADGGRAYGNSLLTATGAVLLVLSLLSVLLAPWIVSLYATPSYTDEQTALAVAFARFCLPQIFFYGVFTMLAQVLNARGHFAMPMFAPIANNIVAISTYLGFIALAGTEAASDGTLTAQQTAWLGLGTTLGVALQAAILIPVLGRTGYSFAPSWHWRGLGLTKAFRLAIWTIGLVAANQIGFMVVTRLATQANVNALEAGTPPAGLATYQTGYLIFILPHSVITVSIVTALLPTLSRTVHAGHLREAGAEIARAARMILLLIAPVAVSLFMLAGPVASLLFGYGAADPAQIDQLGTVTRIFALAIVPFTVYYILLRGWYSMEDTRTPFFFAVVLNIINVAVAVALFPLVEPGAQQIYTLAAAFVVAYWSILLVAWPVLARRFGGLESGRTVIAFLKVFAASLVAMGAAFLVIPLTLHEPGASKLASLFDCFLIAAVVVAVYAGAVWALRIKEGTDLVRMLSGRLGRR